MSAEFDSGRPLFIKHLIATIQCANCGAQYSLDDIHVLGHRGDLWVSAVVCRHCGTQGLIFAMVKDDEETAEVITDVDPEEMEVFRNLPEISMNEVLDMHLFLRDFDGDFSSLFGDIEED